MKTGAEKVLEWMNKFYSQNGTPNFGEIVAQLEMAIDEEKFNRSIPADEQSSTSYSLHPQSSASHSRFASKYSIEHFSEPIFYLYNHTTFLLIFIFSNFVEMKRFFKNLS
jgi:hypothetical protein